MSAFALTCNQLGAGMKRPEGQMCRMVRAEVPAALFEHAAADRCPARILG